MDDYRNPPRHAAARFLIVGAVTAFLCKPYFIRAKLLFLPIVDFVHKWSVTPLHDGFANKVVVIF
jgi:hypothetical protein